MATFFHWLLDGSGLPHGYCFAWDPRLVWVMVASNALVALAYFSIPLALWRFLRLQRGLPFKGIFLLFSAFIFSCGLTHVIDIVNIFTPTYRLDAVLMVLTALVSAFTATSLMALVPRASDYLTQARAQQLELRRVNQSLLEATESLKLRTLESEANQRRFELTLEHAAIGMALVGVDGRWLKVNRALCQMLGYSETELLATNFQQLTHPDSLEADLSSVQQLLGGQITHYQMNKRYFRRDGTLLTAQLDVTLVRDRDGSPLHFISQIQDIGPRLANEEAGRQREEQAQLLSALDGVLQACRSIEEVGPPVARACLRAYPGSRGALFLRNASRNLAEQLHAWGTEALRYPVFAPDDCWAIRRGEAVAADLADPHASHCLHLKDEKAGYSLCLPLLAGGENVGLLSLQFPAPAEDSVARHIASRAGLAIVNLQLRETLRQQSIVDPLTGLYNRRHLEESLHRDLARVERSGETLAVLMIDVDHFKNYNDRHGHTLGDEALKLLARGLQQACRRDDLAARYGGEEFTMVLVGIDDTTALQRADQLRALVAAARVTGAQREIPPITISIGLALCPVHGRTPHELIRAADEALYAAKRGGRNRVLLATLPTPAT